MGVPKTVQKLHKETNQDLIDDEIEAIDGYDRAIDTSDNPEAIATYEHIKGEEEEHIDELRDLDKMKTDDITSEQAWQDFKAGYSDFEEKHVKGISKDRDGDKASLEEKMDVISAKLSEITTDMARLTDSVPQALGTIEESKTLEDEAEQEGMGAEDGMGGEGGFDDGLDDFFADDDGGDAGGFGGEDGEPEVDEDGNPIEDDEDTENDGGDGDLVAEDLPDEEFDDADAEENDSEDATEEDSEDYISMDELMSDDDDEETTEEEIESEEEEVEEKDDDEVLEKMTTILEKMDKRISQLERENFGLKKQLSEMNKVQTERRNVAKSRPTANTNLQLVKGSYNRPPVSTQYVANQRDIGHGMKKESSNNTSIFRQGLNEVFENCERIANQNHF